MQITETVPPEVLFRDYAYFSSFSDDDARARRGARAEQLDRRRASSAPASLVVEIASNDGYLLQYYKRPACPVLGIEPARNIAEVAPSERGIPTLVRVLRRRRSAETLAAEGRRAADVVHAQQRARARAPT